MMMNPIPHFVHHSNKDERKDERNQLYPHLSFSFLLLILLSFSFSFLSYFLFTIFTHFFFIDSLVEWLLGYPCRPLLLWPRVRTHFGVLDVWHFGDSGKRAWVNVWKMGWRDSGKPDEAKLLWPGESNWGKINYDHLRKGNCDLGEI